MKLFFRSFFAILAMVTLTVVGGQAMAGGKPMTNKDVIALVHAHLSQDSILMAINNAKPEFDTSADGLIALNKAGVSEAIIQAMIGAGNGAPAAATPAAGGGINPENVTLVADGRTMAMHYFTPEMRTSARALGFGGVASYAVLRGTSAVLRIRDHKPSFLVSVPDNAQPQNYATVVNFATRKNDTREIATGGGYLSYSTGFPKDRVIPVTFDKTGNRAAAGFTIYRLTPQLTMANGEYALVVNSSQVHVIGLASGLDSYFDFGID